MDHDSPYARRYNANVDVNVNSIPHVLADAPPDAGSSVIQTEDHMLTASPRAS